jgi:hypothetical protein
MNRGSICFLRQALAAIAALRRALPDSKFHPTVGPIGNVMYVFLNDLQIYALLDIAIEASCVQLHNRFLYTDRSTMSEEVSPL